MSKSDNVKHKEMKTAVEKEYVRRLRAVLKSKLNSGNMITAINTWAVAIFRYISGIVEWKSWKPLIERQESL